MRDFVERSRFKCIFPQFITREHQVRIELYRSWLQTAYFGYSYIPVAVEDQYLGEVHLLYATVYHLQIHPQ